MARIAAESNQRPTAAANAVTACDGTDLMSDVMVTACIGSEKRWLVDCLDRRAWFCFRISRSDVAGANLLPLRFKYCD